MKIDVAMTGVSLFQQRHRNKRQWSIAGSAMRRDPVWVQDRPYGHEGNEVATRALAISKTKILARQFHEGA